MDKKEAKALKKEEKLQKKYQKVAGAGKFKQWRNRRPFWGAVFTVLAGLVILYIPVQLYALAFIPGSLVFVGFLFGVVTMFLSVLSIMGALGGFIIGTIIGLIGGALCIAWEMEEVTIDSKRNNNKRNKRETKKQMDEKNAKTAQA
ncbi:DUF6114 domain-containing protein [Lentibacillus sp. N15]|uniref:DUF6114 domain-containing protein n=1 Tax=Lentibacillus songyuanensis TaxID=3136161 RepID=UPI0031BB8A1C